MKAEAIRDARAYPKKQQSGRRPTLREPDDGEEFVIETFNNLCKSYSRFISTVDVLTERFNITIREKLKKIFFENGDGTWIDVLPIVAKKYISTILWATRMTPIKFSLKRMRKTLKLRDKQGKQA